MSHKMLLITPTSCDRCTCKAWSCYAIRFMGRWIYKKMHNLVFDLDLGVKFTQNIAQYPLHHVTYAPAKFENAMYNNLGDARKYIIWSLTKGQIMSSQGHTKHCQVPSIHVNLVYTCKVWICYVQWFKRTNYKKHDGGMDAWTTDRLLYEINIILDCSWWCTIPNTRFLTFDLGVKVTWKVAQNRQRHMTYAPTKFEVLLKENTTFDLDLGIKVMKYCPATSTSRDLCTCKV